jgi:hypothetical protein
MYNTNKIKEFVHEFMDTMAEDFNLSKWPFEKPNDEAFFQELMKDIESNKKIFLTAGILDGSLNKVYVKKSFKEYFKPLDKGFDEFDIIISLFQRKDCPHFLSAAFVKFGKRSNFIKAKNK